jgi:hypothetical protein
MVKRQFELEFTQIKKSNSRSSKGGKKSDKTPTTSGDGSYKSRDPEN